MDSCAGDVVSNTSCCIVRRVQNIASVTSDPERSGRNELDSHADTIVAGANCVLIERTGKVVSVSPFSSEYNSIDDIPIATVATAYDTGKGETYILIYNEALYFGDRMSHTLLCPNQLRHNGLIVDDVPVQYSEKSTHSIFIEEANLRIPLHLDGIISGFTTRQPSMAELADISNHVEMTSADDWNPDSKDFAKAEEKALTNRRIDQTSTRDEESPVIMTVDDQRRRIAAMVVERYKETCNAYTSIELELAEMNDIYGNDDSVLVPRLIKAARIVPKIEEVTFGETITIPGLASDLIATSSVAAIRRGDLRSEITPSTLAKKWMIGTIAAQRTMQVTTQLGVRTLMNPAERRFRTAMPHLRYPRLQGTFYADTLKGDVKSIRGFKYAHIIGNGHGFSKFYPMTRKNETVQSLDDFVQQYGIMEKLVTDGDPTMEDSKAWKKATSTYKINQQWTEPHSPWQNRAELDVREAKRGIRRFTKRTGSPRRLWCFLGELVTQIRSFTAYDSPFLRGRCAAESVLGYTPDISPWIQHGWYDIVWYHDSDKQDKLGRWLGVATRHGGGDAYWILPLSCSPIVRSTVWSMTPEEEQTPEVQERIITLQTSIQARIGDLLDNDDIDPNIAEFFPAPDGNLFVEDAPEEEEKPEDRRSDADDFTPDAYDTYLNAQVLLPRGGESQHATIIGRSKNAEGIPFGKFNSNPILDTREYLARFDDVQMEWSRCMLLI